MITIQVFDPPMCCSTGVCGPAVDPKLVRFASDLRWLVNQGVRSERYNLSQQPQAFVSNVVVRSVLASEGNACLPLVVIDGLVATKGAYPSRQKLAELAGLAEQLAAEALTDVEPVTLPVIQA